MTLRIGVLSFAHMLHAPSYAAYLRQMPDVALVGIADENRERGEREAGAFGTRFFASAEALLEEGLDGAIICSENARHRSLTELAAPRVPAILCEKPIATTVRDARAMIDVCATYGTQLQIAFPVRFSPPVRELKALLDEQRLGRIYAVNATNHGKMPGSWFIDTALAGGGAVIDHTVHVIDLLRWFWNTEVTEVYAEVGYELLHPDLGCDDAGMLSFRLANGVYGTEHTWTTASQLITSQFSSVSPSNNTTGSPAAENGTPDTKANTNTVAAASILHSLMVSPMLDSGITGPANSTAPLSSTLQARSESE